MRKILRLNMRGQDVVVIQEKLIELGYLNTTATGFFGPTTDAAVRQFQSDNNLLVDGVLGPVSKGLLLSKQADSKKLKETDIEKAAVFLDVDPKMIKTFAIIESGRLGGFFDNNHPVILYERHIFRRRAIFHDLDLLAEMTTAQRPDLCNTSMGGYRGGKHEITRLNMASRINKEVALESCSWGRWQIMGFHWQLLGFSNIHEFVEAMNVSEGEQLKILTYFIKKNPPLHRAIRSKNFVEIARLYNGPNFAVNQYDKKLEQTYRSL